MNTVYALLDPTNDEAKYVGVTTFPAKRYHGHLYNTADTPIGVWVRSIRAQGLKPRFVTLETALYCKEANEAEIFWIAYLRSLGARLLNVQQGGGGIWCDIINRDGSVPCDGGWAAAFKPFDM